MKKTLIPAIAILLGSLLGAAGASLAAGPEKFGKPLGGSPRVALEKLTSNPDEWNGKTVTTEGPVSAVCANKGCWMELEGMRVTFKDYGFFVPKDGAGSTAVVEGVFSVTTIPEATAKHYAKETPGGKPDQIKGDQKELSFEATGVEITRAAK